MVRGIENGCSVVRGVYDGLSMSVDARGNIVGAEDVKASEYGAMVVHVPANGIRTLYSRGWRRLRMAVLRGGLRVARTITLLVERARRSECIGERGGIRTRGHRIKSPMLYRLSYPFTGLGLDKRRAPQSSPCQTIRITRAGRTCQKLSRNLADHARSRRASLFSVEKRCFSPLCLKLIRI